MDADRTVLQSPTERGEHVAVLRRAIHTIVSPIPERKGCDFLWVAHGAWCGVQRKRIDDLYASVVDGRLTKELAQIRQGVDRCVFVIEGRTPTTLDGMISTGRDSRSYVSHVGVLLTLAEVGVVLQTDTAAQTGHAIAGVHRWTLADGHSTGRARPKAAGRWGKASSREWAMHFLQGMEGVGPEIAANLFDAHGLPMRWTIGLEDLLQVPGLGKVKARRLWEALGGDAGDADAGDADA
jgi:ERCC4-type nuclease